jgi:hypothetical protein
MRKSRDLGFPGRALPLPGGCAISFGEHLPAALA